MPNPKLYAWYSAEEAIAFFGAPDQAQRLCNGQWVIFPTTAICLTAISVSIGAKTEHPLQFLKPLSDKSWGN
jgi:hypothetical protein